MMKEFKLTL